MDKDLDFAQSIHGHWENALGGLVLEHGLDPFALQLAFDDLRGERTARLMNDNQFRVRSCARLG